MSDTQDNDMWPVAVIIACFCAMGSIMIWAINRDNAAVAAAETENNKNRIEYDKWLLEKGFIKEPRIR